MSRLSPNEMHQLIDQAEPYYLTTGFHVAEHGAEVLDVAQELSSLVLSQGIRVDGQVIVLGSKWHDAGMAFTPSDFYVHDKDTVRPAANSEEVAVELFTQAATRADAPRRLEMLMASLPVLTPWCHRKQSKPRSWLLLIYMVSVSIHTISS
jgi:hypothetical protein